MTTDKEMIELCAKALGYEILEAPLPPGVLWVQIEGQHLIWNPIALRSPKIQRSRGRNTSSLGGVMLGMTLPPPAAPLSEPLRP